MKVSDFIRATRRVGPGLFVLALLSCLVPGEVSAQAVSGTILGLVKDSSGAVIPGATVVVVNTGTGFTRSVITNAQGEYTAPQIPTGNYNVSSEMSGFKKITLANVHVGVDQKIRADLKLDLGEMAEMVEIQAETPLVQTSTSDLSATVDGQVIETLPLNGRNFVALTRTIPGITAGIPGSNISGTGSIAWRASASFSANGQRPRDNNYLLDGVDNNESWLSSVVIFPSVDALDEFKIQTSTTSAEFGRSLGGVVNIQIKSGSNQFKGSVFEFARNDKLDANNFFNNRAGIPRADFSQHYFGGTIGGPIIKDRTFFFADYQGYRVKQGQTFLITVPSEKMRAGDFSEVNRTIYDPLSRQPFAGNIIPQSRWDPAARNVMLDLYPAPNTAGRRGSNGQIIENYIANPNVERDENQFDVKLDHALSSKNRFFLRYSYQKTHRVLPAANPHGDAGQTFGHGSGDVKGQHVAFNDTHTFSDKVINEFRAGWARMEVATLPTDYLQNLADQVGIPGINLNDSTSAMTRIVFPQGSIRNLGSNGNQPLITNLDTFQLIDNVTFIKGRHTFKAGGSLTLRSREILNADTIVGEYQFRQELTSSCGGSVVACTPAANTGFDVASFLLGYASSRDRRLFDAETYTETRPEGAIFVQDDFRVTPRLTLNVGLRWDVFVPYVEVDDRQSNFDPSTGRFVVASDDAVINGVQVGRHLQTYSKADFGPRLGFAWDVAGNARTIVRGGFGVFWTSGIGGTSSSKAQNQPFLQAQGTATNFATTIRLSDGLPAPPGVHPEVLPVGTTRSVFDINARDSYAMNWNVNVQRQFGKNYMVEVAYIGSAGRQMVLKTDQNQAPPRVGVTNQNVNRPYIGISPGLVTVGTVATTGELDYNAATFRFHRRFANRFSFLTSYTFAKTMDLNSDNDGLVTLTNIFDPGYNRGPADYDITHSLVVSGIYELPFGRDKVWGGWQLNGILGARSGLPLTITQTQSVLSTGTGNRPNRIGDGKAADPTIAQWFDPTAFQQVPDTTGTYGTAGRGILRGPGAWNVDASLIKNTRFGRIDTELRIEAFNLFNHPQFANPNTTFGNAAFGTISAIVNNPACTFCGTSERQVQIGLKLKF